MDADAHLKKRRIIMCMLNYIGEGEGMLFHTSYKNTEGKICWFYISKNRKPEFEKQRVIIMV